VIAPPAERNLRRPFRVPSARKNKTVRLHYVGPAHCDCDIVVHLREAQGRRFPLLPVFFHGSFPWLVGELRSSGLISGSAGCLAL